MSDVKINSEKAPLYIRENFRESLRLWLCFFPGLLGAVALIGRDRSAVIAGRKGFFQSGFFAGSHCVPTCAGELWLTNLSGALRWLEWSRATSMPKDCAVVNRRLDGGKTQDVPRNLPHTFTNTTGYREKKHRVYFSMIQVRAREFLKYCMLQPASKQVHEKKSVEKYKTASNIKNSSV